MHQVAWSYLIKDACQSARVTPVEWMIGSDGFECARINRRERWRLLLVFMKTTLSLSLSLSFCQDKSESHDFLSRFSHNSTCEVSAFDFHNYESFNRRWSARTLVCSESRIRLQRMRPSMTASKLCSGDNVCLTDTVKISIELRFIGGMFIDGISIGWDRHRSIDAGGYPLVGIWMKIVFPFSLPNSIKLVSSSD